MKVLIADADATVVNTLSTVLERAGYPTRRAHNGPDALRLWEADPAGAVVVDTHLPRLNGFELCRRLRLEYNPPLILISSSRQEQDVLRAFELGADDYVPKPLSPSQLVARVGALARRYMMNHQEQLETRAEVNGLVIDSETREVLLHGEPLRLTPTEFRVLYILALNPGRVIAFGRLAEYVWGQADHGAQGLLGVHVSHLRKKLAQHGAQAPVIKLARGVGYSLMPG